MSTGTFDRVAPILMGDMIKIFGLTDFQAAGYVGNFGHESGLVSGQQEGWAIGKTCPREELLAHKGGIDWPQWTASRRRDFVSFINANKLPYPTYQASLSFLRHELEGAYRHSLAQVKKTTTLQAAVETAEATYEMAGVKNMSSRMLFATRALVLYRAGVLVPVPSPPPVPLPSPPVPPSPTPSPPPSPPPSPTPSPTPSPPPSPTPSPTPPPLDPGVLPDPKSPVWSRTNIVAILTPVFTYLATIGLKWPDTTREMIITAVSVGLGLLTAFLHSTSNAPVSTSPLAADIERAKADLAAAHAAREQAQEPPRVDPGAVPPAQPVQSDVPVTPVIRPDPALIIEPDYEEEPDVPTNEIDIFDEEGNIDLTRITVAQLISIRKQLPAILAPLGPEPLSEPRLPTVSEFAAIHSPAGHDSDTSNRR